jgi:hypothetical protein
MNAKKYNPYKKFDIINKVCFLGKLPKISITILRRMPQEQKGSMGFIVYANGKATDIVLKEYKNRGNMTLTLLHEMLHYRMSLSNQSPRHTKTFKKREWKLANKLLPHCKEIFGCRV